MVELHPALLQGAVSLGFAAVCWYLYGAYRRDYLLWWAAAWSLYALRIGVIIAFLMTSDQPWLFIHQILTGSTALVLLWAALLYTQAVRWRSWYLVAFAFPVVWSYVAIYQLQSFMLAALPAVLFLSFATLWTSRVFFKLWRATRSRGAAVLAIVLFAWGLHHLDYPMLRAKGAWNPWGYYLDIMFVLAMAIGTVILILEELDRRTRDLQRLSAQMIQQHEEERRRVSLELHDQTAQVWAGVKMQLGVLRESAPVQLTASIDRLLELVDTGIGSIRTVTTTLRPPLLDDLGVVPALRALVHAFAEQSRLEITFDAPDVVPPISSDASLALYRALQESLANVARHSGATAASVQLDVTKSDLTLTVRDNGRGFGGESAENRTGVAKTLRDAGREQLGIAGMRERIAALHGSVDVSSGAGAAITVRVPLAQ